MLRVEGLTNADFIVKDSGIVQNAQIVATDSFPVSLLLAFDASASVRGEPLEQPEDGREGGRRCAEAQ